MSQAYTCTTFLVVSRAHNLQFFFVVYSITIEYMYSKITSSMMDFRILRDLNVTGYTSIIWIVQHPILNYFIVNLIVLKLINPRTLCLLGSKNKWFHYRNYYFVENDLLGIIEVWTNTVKFNILYSVWTGCWQKRAKYLIVDRGSIHPTKWQRDGPYMTHSLSHSLINQIPVDRTNEQTLDIPSNRQQCFWLNIEREIKVLNVRKK